MIDKPQTPDLTITHASDGTAYTGRNEEAKAVLADYKVRFPSKQTPSLATVKLYVSKARAGEKLDKN
jgi:hypothetical protein